MLLLMLMAIMHSGQRQKSDAGLHIDEEKGGSCTRANVKKVTPASPWIRDLDTTSLWGRKMVKKKKGGGGQRSQERPQAPEDKNLLPK